MEVVKFNEFKQPKIVLIQGSPRNIDNCPNENSKTIDIVNYIKNNIKDASFDIIDLTLDPDKLIIHPCKGCISTAGGAHCTYKCSCYNEKNDKMFSENIYDRLEKCDAFIVFTPIHWSAATSQIKSLFDRLVCINQTITKQESIKIFGEYNIKDSKLTSKFEKTDTFQKLRKNHWCGKVAAFYAFGDNGANDYQKNELPEVYTKYCCELKPKECMMPYVWQLRYSDVDVPDELIEAFYINDKICYSCENEKFEDGGYKFMYDKAIKLTNDVISFINKK